jgi:hypothetical protein
VPPRYAYWTILVDEQPTAFRAGSLEDLLPTFNRLKEKSPSVRMVWFQNGKIWNSRVEAQEAMLARGERGRAGDSRQGGFRDRPAKPHGLKSSGPPDSREKLEWRPKGTFPRTQAPRTQDPRTRTPRPHGLKPSRPQDHRPSSGERRDKLEWRPKGEGKPRDVKPGTQDPGKRKWVPKAEYEKSQGIEAKRDRNWRPGGEHKDPRQKYKDAKKAKWTRFKQTVRKRWEGKQGKKKDG